MERQAASACSRAWLVRARTSAERRVVASVNSLGSMKGFGMMIKSSVCWDQGATKQNERASSLPPASTRMYYKDPN